MAAAASRPAARRRVRWATLAGLWAAGASASAQPAPPAAGLTLEAAVTAALEGNAATLGAARRRDAARGALVAAGAAFDAQVQSTVQRARTGDPVLGAAAVGGVVPSAIVTNLTTYGLGVSKTLRRGITVAPLVGVTRSDVSVVPGLVTSKGTAGVTVTAPLWRDLAGAVTTAPERAAREEVGASELELRHARAASAHATAVAYWSYVAAGRQLEALRTAEVRAARLVEETRALARADVRTEADVTRLRANLASKRASRIAAEQAVTAAWAGLLVVTGLTALPAAATPPPLTDFPAPAADGSAAAAASAAAADAQRADLAAARQRRDGMRMLRDAAAGSGRPRLDLVVGVGYVGAEHGAGAAHLITPLGRASSGLNTSVQLRYVLPLENGAARGLLIQSDAAYAQQAQVADDLARRIALRVDAAVAGVRHSEQTLVASRESMELAAQAVENEKRRSALGASTLPDVLLAEDALTGAHLGDIAARLAYAIALADLRFETGALGAAGADGGRAAAALLGAP